MNEKNVCTESYPLVDLTQCFKIIYTYMNWYIVSFAAIACIADEPNPSIVCMQISGQKLVPPPLVTRVFYNRFLYWLLHMAVLLCTVIG